MEEGCRRVIVVWWLESTGGDELRRWQYFWEEGLINQKTASRWAILVWGPTEDELIEADMALGFWEQNAAVVNRESLVEYAVKNDYVWALEYFLERRGWLDDDWGERLEELEEVAS